MCCDVSRFIFFYSYELVIVNNFCLFVDYSHSGLAPSASIMSRHTLSKRVNMKYQVSVSNLKAALSLTKYICTTADAWSICGKEYL